MSQQPRDVDARMFPVVEEEIHIQTPVVDRAQVRITNRVHHVEVDREVPLREHKVRIEQRDADRAWKREPSPFRDTTVEVLEYVERVRLDKSVHVVEEVVVRKEVTVRSEVVTETLRSTTVDVERFDDPRYGTRPTPAVPVLTRVRNAFSRWTEDVRQWRDARGHDA